ncbi:molybdopterin-dependent oxidoreductase [Pedobacter sp. HMF7647]|uniref:Molybdopterin-dependent oxidoreductase n=1 Tax=Hufsiella arboris TaxID=2695275 RepID=A0A7K1Y805_9SPHI|nr:xanthine dehydrogenase family protein molybdopterin-binding subunit [Hufsiella arboris]MXV50715.1 molybdopterin-dependent oxidoreductase [Hufsiella arboris]
MQDNPIGKPLSRVDGPLKVTGEAKYAAEYHFPGMVYGYIVSSKIAKGKIQFIDTAKAMEAEGVIAIYSHENVPKLARLDLSYKDHDAPLSGKPFRPFYTDKILFSQQPVALVIAETFEQARYAASLVQIRYLVAKHTTNFEENLGNSHKPSLNRFPIKSRGKKADKIISEGDVRLDTEYLHMYEHHNPMEMHATTVQYHDDGSLTVYDKTQGVLNSRNYLADVFKLSKKKIRVLSPFVGGAFGSGLRPQYQAFMAVMAALQLKRPVKVSLTRQQMFSFGHRPATHQRLTLGASPNAQLKAIKHVAIAETSQLEDYTENVVNWSGTLYQCNNVETNYRLVPLDIYTPLDMRAPGGATGVHALECAMDELAYKLNIDPLELRLINYAERFQDGDIPFSSKELKECYRQGAEKFGWSRRNPEPRSMKDDNQLVGWGMATGIWEAFHVPVRAHVKLSIDGKLSVSTATSDFGTGTYTIMTQTAAQLMGLPVTDVEAKLGDTNLAWAPLSGGSFTAGSVTSAIKAACDGLKKKLLKLAKKASNSPFKKLKPEQAEFNDGYMYVTGNPEIRIKLTDILQSEKTNTLEAKAFSLPNVLKQRKYARYTHSAVFVEVKVDEDLGTVHVSRVVSAVAAGKILNPKTAHSQIIGGLVWGIGMALHEDSVMDNQFGRFVNHNLAEYHIPVNADIPEMDVIFVNEHDDIVNPMGVKGLGEIGVVGTAAAVANAIFHATGKRVKKLPITLDTLL